jgi:hypothetical protein
MKLGGGAILWVHHRHLVPGSAREEREGFDGARLIGVEPTSERG